MDTLTNARTCRSTTIRLATNRATEFIDLTDQLRPVHCQRRRCTVGLLNIQTRHTTTAIVVNEHEPLLLEDFAVLLLDATAPAIRAGYSHDEMCPEGGGEPDSRRARERSRALSRPVSAPSSSCLNVVDGALQLGRWQRIFLVELDGPREREISVLGVTARRGCESQADPACADRGDRSVLAADKSSLFPPSASRRSPGTCDDEDEVEIQDEHVEALD